MEWLGESDVPFSIVFTKLDKLSHVKGVENIRAYKEKLEEQWEELPPIFLTYSEKRTGRDEVLGYIEGINKSLK